MLSLVAKGVPWEVAQKLRPAQVLAFQIILGQNDGREWDWSRLEWLPPKKPR